MLDIYRFFKSQVGKEVTLRLKNREIYKGKLLDVERSEHGSIGNILLADQKYGWRLIRNNYILYIQLTDEE